MAKIVKKCRRCGHTFEEKRLSPIKVQASNESYVEHRYCARACDPRYVGVGGHGDILAEGPVYR